MNPFSTDIDREFKETADDPAFTRRFFRELSLSVSLSIIGVVLLLTIICNAEEIDRFIFGWISHLFYGINKHILYSLISLSCWLIVIWGITIRKAKNTMLHSIKWGGR